MLNNKISSKASGKSDYKTTIGIFDSGVGGLNVAKAIHAVLPNEKILYIGDTANSPWGNKTRSQIIYYSIKLTEFLFKEQCNLIVVACNTASCVALQSLQLHFPQLKIFNVIDPIIDYVKKQDLFQFQDLGVIGTKQTINSKTYQNNLRTIKNHFRATHLVIKSLATPLLVPVIEEGWQKHHIMDLIIAEYLSKLNLRDRSLLILGCTHYPLIKDQIQNYYLTQKKRVAIIDADLLIAQQLKNFLHKEHDPYNATKIQKDHKFYCTCNNDFFAKIAKQFFAKINLHFLPLWQ